MLIYSTLDNSTLMMSHTKHTISVSGDDWRMKNWATAAWVVCTLMFLQCCSPAACCLMSASPPCATENTFDRLYSGLFIHSH